MQSFFIYKLRPCFRRLPFKPNIIITRIWYPIHRVLQFAYPKSQCRWNAYHTNTKRAEINILNSVPVFMILCVCCATYRGNKENTKLYSKIYFEFKAIVPPISIGLFTKANQYQGSDRADEVHRQAPGELYQVVKPSLFDIWQSYHVPQVVQSCHKQIANCAQ